MQIKKQIQIKNITVSVYQVSTALYCLQSSSTKLKIRKHSECQPNNSNAGLQL